MQTNFGVNPWKVKFALGASAIGEQASEGSAPTAKALKPFEGRLGPKRAASDWNSSIIYKRNICFNYRQYKNRMTLVLIIVVHYLVCSLCVNEHITTTERAFEGENYNNAYCTAQKMHC